MSAHTQGRGREGIRLPATPSPNCYGSDSGFSWLIQHWEAQQEARVEEDGHILGEGKRVPQAGERVEAEGIWTLKPGLGSLSAGTISK